MVPGPPRENMSKDKPTGKVSDRSKTRRPARAWPVRIDADPEEVMRVLMRTPRDQIREEPVDYKAEPPKGSE
jgi:hypothetical protein